MNKEPKILSYDESKLWLYKYRLEQDRSTISCSRNLEELKSRPKRRLRSEARPQPYTNKLHTLKKLLRFLFQ